MLMKGMVLNMEKEYDICFSYSLDLITWTCPCCGTYVEQCGDSLYDNECPNCGYERITERDLSDTYDESVEVTDDIDVEEEDIF